MFSFDLPADLFPPAPYMERAMAWWLAQAPESAEAAFGEFFGDHPPDLQDTENSGPDVARFVEWFLLDQPVEGADSILAAYAAQGAKPEEKARLADVLAGVHGAWHITAVEGPRLTLKLDGEERVVTVEQPELARDASVGEILIGRVFPWREGFVPAATLFFVPELEADCPRPLTALAVQEYFFQVDPQALAELEEGMESVLDEFFTAVAAEDDAALPALLDAEGELALVFDLWGWAGLRVLTDWGKPTGERELLSLEEDLGALRAEVGWDDNRRGTTLWLVPQDDNSWRVTEAVAELGEEEVVNPVFTRLQEKGCDLPWRAEAADAVEAKLRQAMVGRKLPMLDQATMLKAWRLVSPRVNPEGTREPAAWAAAIEAYFRASLGQEFSPNQAAAAFGADKRLVKERYALVTAALEAARAG